MFGGRGSRGNNNYRQKYEQLPSIQSLNTITDRRASRQSYFYLPTIVYNNSLYAR